MQISDLKGKLVAVLGFGKEGQAVTNYLLGKGIQPVIFDKRAWTDLTVEEQGNLKALGLNLIFGSNYLEELAGFDVAFRSPGLPYYNKLLQEQRQKGLVITSQTRWFMENYKGPIIGVTGTKGKGTTSSLVCRMLEADGKKTFLTGNIGEEQPLERLDSLAGDEWVVYELSSFQLQDLSLSPKIAVILMATEEHLDYHKDAAEYVEAKSSVCRFQTESDFAVVNADFENSLRIGSGGKGKKLYFSRKTTVDWGCFVRDGNIMQARLWDESGSLLAVDELKLRGSHNWENVMAAAVAAYCAGCGIESVRSAAGEFKGLQHRLELAGEVKGIKFYNDSFSTTPETAIAAIAAFSEPTHLILGGSSKKAEFKELAEAVVRASHLKSVFLLGAEGSRIKLALDRAGKFSGRLYENVRSLDEVFEKLRDAAEAGDVVLLSPACASFDMFRNYKDRGNKFKSKIAEFGN